jgi:hypothetical protein
LYQKYLTERGGEGRKKEKLDRTDFGLDTVLISLSPKDCHSGKVRRRKIPIPPDQDLDLQEISADAGEILHSSSTDLG